MPPSGGMRTSLFNRAHLQVGWASGSDRLKGPFTGLILQHHKRQLRQHGSKQGWESAVSAMDLRRKDAMPMAYGHKLVSLSRAFAGFILQQHQQSTRSQAMSS